MPWPAARALDNAEQYELYSLYPRLSEDEFHGHRILGHAPVLDSSMQNASPSLKTAARESDGRIMACFEPATASASPETAKSPILRSVSNAFRSTFGKMERWLPISPSAILKRVFSMTPFALCTCHQHP